MKIRQQMVSLIKSNYSNTFAQWFSNFFIYLFLFLFLLPVVFWGMFPCHKFQIKPFPMAQQYWINIYYSLYIPPLLLLPLLQSKYGVYGA